MKKIYITIFLFGCMLIKTYGQNVETFIAMAYENHPGLMAAKYEYEAAKYKIDQLGDYPDPQVSLGLGVLPIQTRVGAQRFKVGISQAILWKGTLDARKGLAAANAEVLAANDQVKVKDIENNIRSAYASLLFLDERSTIIDKKLSLLDALEEIAKSAVRAGKGKLSNVLLVERNRAGLNADKELIKKQIEVPTIMINRLAGRSLLTAIETETMNHEPVSEEAYMAYAVNDHPQLKVLDAMMLASQKSADITSLNAKPKIMVGLDYGFIDGRNDVDIPKNGRDVLMPMGSISIPLHKGRYEAKRAEEKMRQAAIKAKAVELSDQYQAEIMQAQSAVGYATMEKEKYNSLYEITEETIQLMRQEYAAEGTRFEELLRLEMELIDYELEIAKANFEMELALSNLNKYQ